MAEGLKVRKVRTNIRAKNVLKRKENIAAMKRHAERYAAEQSILYRHRAVREAFKIRVQASP